MFDSASPPAAPCTAAARACTSALTPRLRYSVGQATFSFGTTPGGAHSAVGHSLAEPVQNFRASQSKIGCSEGVGVGQCVALCDTFGLDSFQLQAKCGLN